MSGAILLLTSSNAVGKCSVLILASRRQTNWMECCDRTKEQANHSLPYLLAVTLLDGDVMPAQFKPERIIRPDVQSLLKKVSVRPNHEFTEVYPAKMPAKTTVRLQDGTVIEHEVQDYPGLASRPFTWEDAVEKFDRLVTGRVDEGLSTEIKDAARSVEHIQVRDLMKLLGSVKTALGTALVIERGLTTARNRSQKEGRNSDGYYSRPCSPDL